MHVRLVPIADTIPALLDNLIGALLERQRHVQAERLRSLEIDHQFVLGRRLHRQVAASPPLGCDRRSQCLVFEADSVGKQRSIGGKKYQSK
jgi:hypothetical protein